MIRIKSLRQTSSLMFVISGPLGMSLDNYHGLFNVLNYNPNSMPLQLITQDSVILLKSAVFVPFLFGIAGFVMSVLQLYLDQYFNTPIEKRKGGSWPSVFNGIGFFALQYYLSGYLDHMQISGSFINIFLFIYAIFGWYMYDNSKAGISLAILTALAGPFAELLLVNVPQLYTYTHADFYGICSWIPWVYFFGASAVGNLARKIYSQVDDGDKKARLV